MFMPVIVDTSNHHSLIEQFEYKSSDGVWMGLASFISGLFIFLGGVLDFFKHFKLQNIGDALGASSWLSNVFIMTAWYRGLKGNVKKAILFSGLATLFSSFYFLIRIKAIYTISYANYFDPGIGFFVWFISFLYFFLSMLFLNKMNQLQ